MGEEDPGMSFTCLDYDVLCLLFDSLANPLEPGTIAFALTCRHAFLVLSEDVRRFLNVSRLAQAMCITTSGEWTENQEKKDLVVPQDFFGGDLMSYPAMRRLVLGCMCRTTTKFMKMDGAVAIGKALALNSSLVQLELVGQSLGSEGVVSIAQSLETNTVLTSLNISYSSDVSFHAGVALGKMLGKNTTLSSLLLRQTKIHSDGGIGLARGLKKNSALMRLNVDCTNIALKGTKAILKAWLASERDFLSIQPEGREEDECRTFLRSRDVYFSLSR